MQGYIANKLTYRSTPKKKVRIATLEMTWETDICGKGTKIPCQVQVFDSTGQCLLLVFNRKIK